MTSHSRNRRPKDNPVIREYEQAVRRGDRMLSSAVWVTRHPEGWQVKRPSAGRAAAIAKTQAEAIDIGTEMAKRDHSELFITGRDGKIQERNSYGR